MSTPTQTMPTYGAIRPLREHGSSALDAVTWAAPDPSMMVLDADAQPVAVAPAAPTSWSAPDPALRVDLPAPVALSLLPPPAPGSIVRVEFVEPMHPVATPDLHEAARVAIARHELPPPTLADAAEALGYGTVDRRRGASRWVVGVAAAAATVALAATAAVALL